MNFTLTNDGYESYFESEPAPKSFQQIKFITRIVSTTSWVYFLCASFACATRMRQLLSKQKYLRGKGANKGMKICFWILFQSVCALLMTSNNFIMFFYPFNSEKGIVCDLSARFPAIVYTLGLWGSYMVFVYRCGNFKHGNKWLRLFYQLTVLTAVTGPPLVTFISLFYFRGVLFFQAEYCVQFLPTTPAIIFMFADSNLSCCFLFLFLQPVLKYLRQLRNSAFTTHKLEAEAVKIRRAAFRNFRLSLVQIISTFVVLMTSISINAYLKKHRESPEAQFWLYVGYMLYIPDAVVNNLCLLFMTRAWIPEGWNLTKRIFSPKRIDAIHPAEKTEESQTSKSLKQQQQSLTTSY